jgi:hypothetical protein
MKAPILLLALAALAGCASGMLDGTSAAGQTADAERASTLESPAPRRHQGNLSRGGVYDN